MGLQELRFFSIYLSKINPRNPEGTRLVRLPLTEFGRIMELKRIDLRTIEPAADGLLQKIVHLREETGGFTAFQLFSRCKVTKDENNDWFIEINAHDEALPLMFEFKDHYFSYQLWNALRLKSSNQLRMYEILKQFEYIKEKTFSITDLKALLGIELYEYPRWDRFRIRVLDSCQQALEEYTDIKFTYEPIKKRNKVVSVKFIINKNSNYIDPLTLDKFIDAQDLPIITTGSISSIAAEQNTNVQKKSASEKKSELDTAKQSPFWYYALQIAEKKKGIKKTPPLYATGIVKQWRNAGYKTVQDLLDSGEITQEDVERKIRIDSFENNSM